MAKKQPESAEDSAGRAKEKKLSKDKIKKKDRKEKKGKKKDAKHKLLEAAVEGDGEEDMEMVEDVDGPETAPKVRLPGGLSSAPSTLGTGSALTARRTSMWTPQTPAQQPPRRSRTPSCSERPRSS